MIDMFRSPSQKEFSYNHHKDIMKKLKFIGKIDPGDRINVNTVSTSSNNLFSSLYRIVFKESRVKTYQFLSDVIDRSFELIILYQSSKKMSDKITCSHIIEDLHHAITGLKNIQHTYMDDRNFYCDIDTLIGSIYARLAEYYQQDNSIFTEEQRKRLHVILFPHEAEEKELTNPPIANPPIANPPIANPLVANPPIANLPIANPPIANLPVANSLVVNPLVANPPIANPPIANLPVANSLVVNPVQEMIQSSTHKTDMNTHDIVEIEHDKKKEKHKK